ncbi:hypothetical protein D3C78_1813800 [compost metagenome]
MLAKPDAGGVVDNILDARFDFKGTYVTVVLGPSAAAMIDLLIQIIEKGKTVRQTQIGEEFYARLPAIIH